eukprot:7986121-Pyramimonas_sp.AAC.1
MQGGSFSKRGSRNSSAHTRLNKLQEFQGVGWLTSQKQCCGTMQDCQEATIMLIRGVELPGM